MALHVGRSFAAQILDEEPTVFPGGVALGEERTSHFSAEVLQIGHKFLEGCLPHFLTLKVTIVVG